MTAMRPAAIDTPDYSETLPCKAGSAHRARLLVDAAVNVWRLGGLADDAKLIRCHLIRLTITRPAAQLVRVAVTDKNRRAPVPTEPKEDGRGLILVEAVAHRWDTDVHRWGKTVWAELIEEQGQDADAAEAGGV
ncbi:ATP-binding protein [Streptomyces sp. AK02-01A]|uniref:ATP-binding protein n=1 Tax=Streptomyces sp. AK02-01A TaxID=3028648 RepID=UPI0029AD5992|nr:ATP-binding protein [Streptomyces sp. AK02-01A]MDX3851745.1 ATP-binding protein [Streptomyces sp. AK02-01A]